MAEIDTENPEVIQNLKEEFRELIEKSIHRYANILQSPGATGEQIQNTREAFHSFGVYNAEYVRYGARVLSGSNLFDVYGISTTELAYEAMATSIDLLAWLLSLADLLGFDLGDCVGKYYGQFCPGCQHVLCDCGLLFQEGGNKPRQVEVVV
jgi:hypothetical protein